MHELQIAGEIIDVVEREMTEQGIIRLESVALRIGALSCINSDSLAFGFEAAVMGTPLEGGRLIIEEVQIKARCNSCGGVSEIEMPAFVCSHCSGRDLEIIAGEELQIDYIIGE